MVPLEAINQQNGENDMKKFDLEKAKELYAIYVEAKKNCPYFGTRGEKAAWTRKKNAAMDAYDKYLECGKYCNPE